MRRVCLVFICGLLLAACSLAGDVTPPPGSLRPSILSPASKPSAADGASLYAQHCAACHGVTGKGDGSVASQLAAQRTEPMPDFSSPELARAAAPDAWFQVITQGRLEKLMPPWADKLSEAERWNLVAFLYTLSTPQTQLDSGKAIYDVNCAQCHGANGGGNGPAAAGLSPLPDFTDQAYMAGRSQAELFTSLTDGAVGTPHNFASVLTDDERWAALDYVRAFSYSYAALEEAPVEQVGRVRGRVQNGTAGAAVPAGLEVTLHAFDNFQEVETLTATITSAGSFEFSEVPYTTNRNFILSTIHSGVTYGSDVFSFGEKPEIESLLQIYEATSDPAALRVERAHIFFDFSAGDRQATVGELFLFSNEGDKTFAPESGQSLEFPLPPGATDLTVQGGEAGTNYVHTAQGFILIAPIRPGSGAAQILFSFRLPYERQLGFAQKILYPVSSLDVLLPETGVSLQSPTLQDGGIQEIEGTVFRTYQADGLPAGETISFQLSGRPSGASSLTNFNWVSILIGASALALVFGGIGYWWYSRRENPDESPSRELRTADDRGELLQAIADLDDAFEEGSVDKAEYERRRASLKARLLESVNT